ncbi:TRIC cation channel family protein [Rhodanobacter lindaniclasticus]
MVAVRHRLDIFGVLVLAFAAGNAGGITRDVLIGALPPGGNRRRQVRRRVCSRRADHLPLVPWPPVASAATCCGSTRWGWRSSRWPGRRRRCCTGSTR